MGRGNRYLSPLLAVLLSWGIAAGAAADEEEKETPASRPRPAAMTPT